MGWEFLGNNGDFKLDNPQKTSYLYFPIGNDAGMMGAITPSLNGDTKTSQNTFLLEPVSAENLHNNRSSRNFWLYSKDFGAWSAAGNSAKQISNHFADEKIEKTKLEAGFLWHKITIENKKLGLKSEITNFCPVEPDKIELMEIKITNTGKKSLKLTPTAAVPLYGRSAADIRDHRHVTSLLHRVQTTEYGVEVQPALSFDERGHKPNSVAYGVFAATENGKKPEGFFPLTEDFIGEGGTFDWPEAVVANQDPVSKKGHEAEGYEATGAIRFAEINLKPGDTKSFYVGLVVRDEGFGGEKIAKKYLSEKAFNKSLEDNKEFWQKKLSVIGFKSGDKSFDNWMQWVSIQPILRRIYGCSFLPHHDYGRGGRGWRDLWQDCLALLIMEPIEVKGMLLNNYGGVRMDGSNATIIGSAPGEFIADRNNIARVWMDHGAWPLLTTLLYINQSGDLDFLLLKQTYFKDKFYHQAKKIDDKWTPDYGNKQKTSNGKLYEGTVLEHILLQNLVQFFNVGEHNNIRLEGADWNDGLDMASQKGESVAFTAFYASNLIEIANLLKLLSQKKGFEEIDLSSELQILLGKVNYDSVKAKNSLLAKYCQSVRHNVAGKTKKVLISKLAADLEEKANWMFSHLRKNEWIRNKDGQEWFNGYYDNKGARVEGDFKTGVRMTLTGQVFQIMGGVATNDQVERTIESVQKYLKDKKIGGYRLNTNFHEVKLDMGRLFGFAFGHKENGAVFSHMAIMYGNALYKRGFVKEGFDVMDSLYQLSADFDRSRIYPGIPEYFNERRRGMYHYLTGSASWMLLTILTEVYGVKGKVGDLYLEPKLLKEQFDKNGKAGVTTLFANKNLTVNFTNTKKLQYGKYSIKGLKINGKAVDFSRDGSGILISRAQILSLADNKLHTIEVELG